MSITNSTTDITEDLVKAPSGFVAVPLKSQKHADLTAAAIKGFKANVKEWTLLVPKAQAEANKAIDALAEAARVSEHIYDARLLTASWVGIMNSVPGSSTARPGVTAQLVNALAEKAKGKWHTEIQIDGTLRYSWDGQFNGLGVREALAKVDPTRTKAPAKAASKATKSTAKAPKATKSTKATAQAKAAKAVARTTARVTKAAK